MARNYAALPHDYLTEMELLTDEEFGRLCRALLRYSMGGEAGECAGNERFMLQRVYAQEDRFQASYDELCEKNRANGMKGGRPRKDSSSVEAEDEKNPAVFSETQKTQTETETKTETETETETEKRSREKNASHSSHSTAAHRRAPPAAKAFYGKRKERASPYRGSADDDGPSAAELMKRHLAKRAAEIENETEEG